MPWLAAIEITQSPTPFHLVGAEEWLAELWPFTKVAKIFLVPPGATAPTGSRVLTAIGMNMENIELVVMSLCFLVMTTELGTILTKKRHCSQTGMAMKGAGTAFGIFFASAVVFFLAGYHLLQ